MTDRLRFRVWSFEKKTYIEAGVLLRSGDLAIPTMKNDYNLSAVQNDKFVAEQCTGLKDREGTLIYEGDIVIWNDGGGECELKPQKGWVRIAEVKLFPDLHFKIIGCYPKRTCEIGHEFHFGNFIYTETEKHLKVIGNIHKNADLLEGKSEKPIL